MFDTITKITFDGIREAAAAGESITVIINGEYYDIDTVTPAADPNEAFIDGVNFAAAVIEDRRARQNCVFEGIALNKRTSKAARAANYTRNDETKSACNFLEYITQSGLDFWRNEYKVGKLWRLRT